MKLHSNIIEPAHFTQAINAAVAAGDIPAGTVSETVKQGSRSRSHGITFRLGSYAENRNRARNTGQYGGEHSLVKAASYHDHGHVFAHLFDIDPDAIIGQYDGADDFHEKTRYGYDLDAEARPDCTCHYDTGNDGHTHYCVASA